MRHLMLFENFNQDFPDVWNQTLIRGSKVESDEYVDDPSTREVHMGDASKDHNFINFMKNWNRFHQLPDPTKSVHFFLNPKKDGVTKYGKSFEVLPKQGTVFGFYKVVDYGGLGDTYWSFPNEQGSDNFGEEITNYQGELIKNGQVGKVSFQELLELSKQGIRLHIWTESPCLLKKIKKEPKDTKAYKNEPTLNDEDFNSRNLDNNVRREFYSQKGREVRNLSREEALRVLDEWINGRSGAQRI